MKFKGQIIKVSRLLTSFAFCSVVIALVVLYFKSDFYRNGIFYGEDSDKESQVEDGKNEDIETTNAETVGVDFESESKENLESEGASVLTFEELYKFDSLLVNEGEMAIIPMDISMSQNGLLYIDNKTEFLPDTEALLMKDFSQNNFESLSNNNGPKVLIIHTHTSEGYLEKGKVSYKYDEESELARTTDESRNVVSLGKIISEIMNDNGIYTVHCTVSHDTIQRKDSYHRSEETIRKYLEKYPSIRLVIDIHRDALMTTAEDIIRPVTIVDNEATAQVGLIVGSGWESEKNNSWEDNLSLALKLRKELNEKYINLCRPIELRSEAYNQDVARYSINIVIGSIGNDISEAEKSAKCVGEALAEIAKIIPF